jgi:hypothetical protein
MKKGRGALGGAASLTPDSPPWVGTPGRVPSPRPSPEGRGRSEHGAVTLNQVENEVPQPQEDLAFGLLNLKPAPVTLDTKSISVPDR